MTKFLEKPDWIDELKEPFLPHRIADRAVRGLISNEGSAERISAAFIAEVKRRVTIIADFLGMSYLPQTETEWLLIYYLCRHWHIPAFEEKSLKKRGAKPKWTDKKRLKQHQEIVFLVGKEKKEHIGGWRVCLTQ